MILTLTAIYQYYVSTTLDSAIVVRKQLWAICKWMGVAGSGHRRPYFANPWLKLKASYINKIYWNVNMFIYEKIYLSSLVSISLYLLFCFIADYTMPPHSANLHSCRQLRQVNYHITSMTGMPQNHSGTPQQKETDRRLYLAF